MFIAHKKLHIAFLLRTCYTDVMPNQANEPRFDLARFSQGFQRFSHLPPSLEQINDAQKVIKQVFPLLKQMQRRFRTAGISHFFYIASGRTNGTFGKSDLNSPLLKNKGSGTNIFFSSSFIQFTYFTGIYTRTQINYVIDIMNDAKPLLECLQQESPKLGIQTDYTENIDSIIIFVDFASNGISTEAHDAAYDSYYMQSKIKSSLKDIRKIHSDLKILQKKLAELSVRQ